MNVPLRKSILVFCLTVVLVSAGTAWALQQCLMRSESVEHVHVVAGELPTSGLDSAHHHKPHARIHCPENKIPKLSFGPASSTFRLEPPNDTSGALVHARAPTSMAASFAWTVRLSIGAHLSPLIFISKLRI